MLTKKKHTTRPVKSDSQTSDSFELKVSYNESVTKCVSVILLFHNLHKLIYATEIKKIIVTCCNFAV